MCPCAVNSPHDIYSIPEYAYQFGIFISIFFYLKYGNMAPPMYVCNWSLLFVYYNDHM